MKLIDYRSDTVTQPTAAMHEAMMNAKLGDDVFGEDPTVNELETKAAALFDMEAALFCPSGTMTNQIGIKMHTQPGDEVICDFLSHVYQYEGGGIAFNSGASVRLLTGNRGRIEAAQVKDAINPDDAHKPRTSLVVLENTSNRGGGSCYELSEIELIKKVCAENKLQLHLDGARLFNALVYKNQSAKEYGRLFDSVSICLSKGLGCPVGSVLIGRKDDIKKARRIRKVFGGGMRQAGVLAAAGIYALDHHIERLAEDHTHAKAIEAALLSHSKIESVLPVETNIIIFNLKEGMTAAEFVLKLKEKGVLAFATGKQSIRFVTHLDISKEMVDETIEILKTL
ncbi:MAG: aminotransferase class I/II-fold pyridoxal phosphate-dependent enzyme [Chitinophagaceae bacterium]|nr:aminotransferase class I/II-fold pyridoxal phosphate-dependent enzyme [Chitinophagaceae bacterium]